MDDILIEKHFDFLRCNLGSRQQGHVVDHDRQADPISDSPEVVEHILFWRAQKERRDQHQPITSKRLGVKA
jgi:hypothetical protein